jgi:hypothetical protein
MSQRGAKDTAYRVPWRLDRPRNGSRYALVNEGDERLFGVSISLFGGGLSPALPALSVDPGDALVLTIVGADLARSTVGVIRWFRPDNSEYLWRVSF